MSALSALIANQLHPGCFFLLIALGAGCQISVPDRAHYYFLESGNKAPVRQYHAGNTGDLPFVGVRIQSPKYLRDRRLVVQVGEHELRWLNLELWAEPPEAGVLRVMKEEVAWAVPQCQVVSLPTLDRKRPLLELDIELRALQAKLVPQPGVKVEVAITVWDGSHGRLLAREGFAEEEPWDGKTYSALPVALGRATEKIAAELAKAVPQWIRESVEASQSRPARTFVLACYPGSRVAKHDRFLPEHCCVTK